MCLDYGEQLRLRYTKPSIMLDLGGLIVPCFYFASLRCREYKLPTSLFILRIYKAPILKPIPVDVLSKTCKTKMVIKLSRMCGLGEIRGMRGVGASEVPEIQ